MLKNEIIFSNKNFPREFEPKDWFKNVDNVPFFFFFSTLTPALYLNHFNCFKIEI